MKMESSYYSIIAEARRPSPVGKEKGMGSLDLEIGGVWNWTNFIIWGSGLGLT